MSMLPNEIILLMTQAHHRKASKICFKLPTLSSATSSDGAFIVLLTPGQGKKKNQLKRKRAERTTTRKLREPVMVACGTDGE